MKPNSLEDKIFEYLKNSGAITRLLDMQYNNLAHDIAEICEKEYSENYVSIGNVIIGTRTKNKIAELKKENTNLKQQIDRLHKNEIIYHERLGDIPSGQQ